MQASKWLYLGVFPLILLSCTKEREITQKVKVKNEVYRLDTVAVYASGAEKTKVKSASQYQSILYNDIYQKSIPSNKLNDLSVLSSAIGDKGLANELVATGYLKDPGALLPSPAQMRADISKFVQETYLRFYLRQPTETELYYFTELIKADPNITPDQVYAAFITSNEYSYY